MDESSYTEGMPDGTLTYRHANTGRSFSFWNAPDKITRHMAAGHLYERPFLDWILAQQFSGCVLDIGANVGQHTLWMAAICGLDVVSFEPVIPHVTRANVHLNPHIHEKVRVMDVALGDVPGAAHHKAKGVIVPGTSVQSTDEAFDIVRLDELELPPTSFWKLDIEGFEANALRGAQQTIYNQRPVIATEEWDAAATKEISKILVPMNYKRVKTFGGRGRAPMAIWQPS